MMMNALWQDLNYGFRMLLKHPGVTAVAVITLALGIGANTAIFSVVNAVLLNPLPYKQPDRLVSLWENVPTHGRWRVSPANFFDWKKQNTVFEDVATFGAYSMTLTGDGEPEQLTGAIVSSGYFAVVGVDPILGRAFLPEEYETGKGQVVILGHAFWQRRYAGDKNIINRNITLNGAPYTVVGVLPPGIYPAWPTTSGHLTFDEQQQFWTPMSFTPQWAAVRSAHVFGVVARLKAGISLEQASAEMNTIAVRLEQEHSENRGEGIIVNPFINEVVGNVRPALFTLLGAVALVLLIACANVAGLLLAQHAGRSKEIAIRAALGAGRTRLVRQFFVEGLLLSFFGTAIGLGIAALGTKVLLQFVPRGIPRLAQVSLDWRVLGFTMLLSLGTCLIFGLVPAWHASKPDLHTALEQSGRTSGPGASRLRFRQLLVVFQVSIAVMLVIGAGLLIKSFWMLQRVDSGFNSAGVLTASITLPASKYAEPVQINNFHDQLLERVSALPGVKSATIAYDHPLQSNWIDSFEIEGRPAPADDKSLSSSFMPVGPDYFDTVGVRLVAGRLFTPQDDPDHPGAAIVNETFVKHYFPNENPLGQRMRPSPPGRIWKNQRLTSFEIVGVVHDVKFAGLEAPSEPAYYLPASQAPLQDMMILVRTTTDPLSVVGAVRQAVLSIDPNQPISDVKTLAKIVDESIAQRRLNMLLMGLFGGLALLLSAVGIYGLLSYAVTQRTQEMGIRMALGAQISDVLKLVLRQGMMLALAGEAIGLIAALALTRMIRGLLFGVTPNDATTFVVVAGVLAIVALLACYLPARRATKVDPLVALRYE
ncbi:MAG TPA: ABC transporter permease [Pyrinomonadaceae bacterium]|nr:ABC transporter permease [Pyrinomonadaceae bacterium]